MRRSAPWAVWTVLGLILIEVAAAAFLATRGSGPGSAATASATVMFEMVRLVGGEAAELSAAVESYERLGQTEAAEEAQARLVVLERYLQPD